jgi:hypothetical protein
MWFGEIMASIERGGVMHNLGVLKGGDRGIFTLDSKGRLFR